MMKGYRVELSNGTAMPALGLGTYKTPDGHPVEQAVTAALEAGYRCVDTASFYGNEAGIGRALAGSGVPREELFITTKVWNSEQGHGQALEAFQRSIEKLGLDYLDLYLIHWPVREMFMETWRALEELYRKRKVRAIGVSNFLVHHLEVLLGRCEEPPVVNQV
ncbi:MAG TPA: aldo/keto reductase, partial [Spirochaetes bacterium]|nr:aldo/keto reductase [Spirochaetota bacterium]